MTPKQIIEVVTAFHNGKKIEWNGKKNPHEWEECYAPVWDFSTCDYRIKPNPPPTVKLLAYLTEFGSFVLVKEGSVLTSTLWKRIPSEDKTVVLEE